MVRSLVWVGLLALATGGGQLLAQSPRDKPGEPEVFPPGLHRSESAFNLFADRDFARSGLRMADQFSGIVQNDGNWATPTQRWNLINNNPLQMPTFFDIFFYFGVGPGERDRAIAQGATSLANANNKGYTVNSQLTQYSGETLGGDQTLGPFHAGALDSGAGDCRDFTTLASGEPLLAASDCEVTWGSLGWQGSKNVTAEGWEEYAAAVSSTEFSFDPWKVPEDMQAEGLGLLGAFQTFGFTTDYSTEALFGSAVHQAYNNVVPGGTGAATRSGWPLGMWMKMDAFHTPALNLTNVAWLQFTIVNNSELVYGVALDYDSLYMGIQPGWFPFEQGAGNYRDPTINAVRAAAFCQGFVNSSSQGTSGNGCGPGGDPQHFADGWGTAPPNGVGSGFNYGAMAILTLKSPIGDIRNKMFTDPTSAFFGLGDMETWDDTITFNHGHMCGFHGCSAVVWNAPASTTAGADYEQRQYGMVASITSDVLGNRNVADLTQHTAWDTWRWEEYPDVNQMDFNRWTPGGWDWDGDLVDDELAWDDCTDNSAGQFDPWAGVTKNCAVTWSDTLPGGFGNVYSNRGAVIGVGPIAMAAYDTVQWVFAVVLAEDEVGLELQISEAVDHYMNFYLAPAPPPAPNIVSVDVEQGGGNAGPDAETQPAAAITLYWDDSPENYVDPFIAKTLTDLAAADDASPAGRLRNLNPTLIDTLTWLLTNNVEAIHIFKSCDGGGGFTDDGNCNDDPATSGGIFGTAGWLPYASFNADADGNFPKTFSDGNVFGGRSFLYSLLSESRGLALPVQIGDDAVFDVAQDAWLCTLNCSSTSFDIPKLLAIVPTSTSLGNVVDVYVPVANQAGSVGSTVAVIDDSPDFVPFDRMNVNPTQSEVADGDYLLAFGDAVIVTEVRVEGNVTSTAVVIDGADTYSVNGAVALSDAPFTSIVVGDTETRTYTFDAATTSVLVGPNDVPLVVSDQMSGSATVPGSYFGLPNYPHITYQVDNSLGGSFAGLGYFDADTVPIGPQVEPSVTWRDNVSSGVTAEGRYAVTWLDPAFGSASPFFLDFTNPTNTKSAVVTSLQNRSSVTSSTDPAIASFVGLPAEALLAVELPFTVQNVTDLDNPTDVQVAITVDGKLTELVLGNGLDTMIVSENLEDQWLPGDGLLLVEGEAPDFIITAADGILGCDATLWVRTECNPVALSSRGATGYIENARDQILGFEYYQTITAATEYTFSAASAVTGGDVINPNNADAIRASLDSVKVVPNPYVMFSAFATQGGTARVIFTHVPPKGVLRMYTVSGQFVQKINWGPNDLNGNGDLFFDLRTREGNEMAAGLYLFVLTAKDEQGTEIGTAKGKFVLIK